MATPAFLTAPFRREAFTDRKMFDYYQRGEERRPALTDEEKELLRKQYPNNTGGITDRKNVYTVYAARTAYTCTKVVQGVFKVSVYNVSNKMDTSRPKDIYFLVRKEANA